MLTVNELTDRLGELDGKSVEISGLLTLPWKTLFLAKRNAD
jgi:hypothetical protein